MAQEIKIPKYFDTRSFDHVLEQEKKILAKLENNPEKVRFDFSETRYISSLGVLLIAKISDMFISMSCPCYAVYGKEKSSPKWFMRIMGVTEGDGKTSQLINEYLDSVRVGIHRCSNANESLSAINNKLLPVIKNNFSLPGSVLKALGWALWETIDNSGIHGYGASPKTFDSRYSRPVYFCAYAYEDDIDIAILDLGQGIQGSFRNLEKYGEISNQDALTLAVEKGATSCPGSSAGIGLFGCSELAKQSNGRLVITSNDNTMEVTRKGIKISGNYPYQGTMVSLTLPKDMLVDLESLFGKNSPTVTEDFDDIFGKVVE